MGNFIPARGAAWALLSERAAVLAGHCTIATSHEGAPGSLGAAAEAATTAAARLASHVPPDLRPA
jgi:hypothetical protein